MTDTVDDTVSKDVTITSFTTASALICSLCREQGKMNISVRRFIASQEVLDRMRAAKAIELVSWNGRYVPMFMGREIIPVGG